MPFLNSSTIRPLYDVHDGGPPKGFRCMANELPQKPEFHCTRVTRTLAGMRIHQRIVHGIKQQQEFNFEALLSTQRD